jgi:hypothetical protein
LALGALLLRAQIHLVEPEVLQLLFMGQQLLVAAALGVVFLNKKAAQAAVLVVEI